MILPQEDLQHILDQTKSLWNQFRGKKVFLTGGTGFLGSWLVESFLFANDSLFLGAEMKVLSRNPAYFLEKRPHLKSNPSLQFVVGDVRDFKMPEGAVDFVIHAAMDPSSVSPGQNANEKAVESFDVGYSGTKRVLEMCRAQKGLKYLFISSGAVYGPQPENLSSIEESFSGAPNLNSSAFAYGEGKRVAEWLGQMYGESYGFDAMTARCFAFVGPLLPLNGHFAVGNFIRQVLAGEDLVIKGDGLAQRSYMYASDMTIWLWHILVRGQKSQSYNVGAEKAWTMRDLAQKIIEIENPKLKLRVLGKATSGISGDLYLPSTRKAREQLGLKLSIDEETALRKTLEFYKKLAEAK
jgi:dTDP-glucose 4,6-dehydratase